MPSKKAEVVLSFPNDQSGTTRVFPRAVLGGRVFIHDEEKLYIAPIQNISAGGVFINQLVMFPKGKTVRLVIKATRLAAPVQATGTVVRVENNGRSGLAVEFKSIATRDREAIQKFVSEEQIETTLKIA